MVQLHFDVEGLDDLLEFLETMDEEAEVSIRSATKKIAEEIHSEILEEMRTKHDRTGETRETIIVRKISDDEYSVESDSKVVKFLELGTKPHRIIPRNRSVLRFEAGTGEIVFTPFVDHPGTPAYHIFRRAEERARRKYDQILNKEFKEFD